MTLATRLAVMRAGKIQQLDAPDVVYAKPANMFVAGFLGSPRMNFIKGHLRNSGGRVQFESAVFQADVSDYAFAQRYRDVLGLQIGDGTANIMKMIIAREKSGMRLT